MNRSEARQEAFKLIFQVEAQKEDYAHVLEQFCQDNQALRKTDRKQYIYITNVAAGVYEKKNELDEIIKKNLAPDWKLSRLSRASLAILRLAVYEILYLDDVPDRVAINEAVNLSKIYDADEAPAFINGVLSGVVKSVR